MKNTDVSVKHGSLSIDSMEHLHISQVDVFTGDDNYMETDSIEVTTQRETLCVKKLLTSHPVKTNMRSRGEPGCRLHVASESGNRFIVTISHHKGSIIINAKELEASYVV